MSSVYVFAYGSNLCVGRIRLRAPSATPVAVACLEAHKLLFHKRGRDGSGKADAYLTSDPWDAVWGMVFKVSKADKAALDYAEGAGSHYDATTVEVYDRIGNKIQAWIYRARTERIDTSLAPYDWYQQLVVEGARMYDLPAEYVAAVAAVDAIDDPDRERAGGALRCLQAIA